MELELHLTEINARVKGNSPRSTCTRHHSLERIEARLLRLGREFEKAFGYLDAKKTAEIDIAETPITRSVIKVLLFENVQYNFMQNPKIENNVH